MKSSGGSGRNTALTVARSRVATIAIWSATGAS
jgi:hypothetical protein